MSRLDELIEGVFGPSPQAPVAAPAGHGLFVGNEYRDTEGTQSFTVASGKELDVPLGFVCGSVIIDNNTSAYINIPDATKDGTGRFIGPGQGGAFPILGHISRARIKWVAPGGRTQPAFVAGEQAVVVFAAAGVPPGFGFASPVGTPAGVEAFPLLDRAGPATYTFDIPTQTAFRGIVVFLLITGGAGTMILHIADRDPITGIVNDELVSASLSTSSSRMALYPGVATLANLTGNMVITPNVRLSAVLSGGDVIFQVAYYLIP